VYLLLAFLSLANSDQRVITLLPKQQYCYRVSSNLIYLPHCHFWCRHQLPCHWGISQCQYCHP